MNPMPPARPGPGGTFSGHTVGTAGPTASSGGAHVTPATETSGTTGRRERPYVPENPWLEDESGVAPPVLGKPDFLPGER